MSNSIGAYADILGFKYRDLKTWIRVAEFN